MIEHEPAEPVHLCPPSANNFSKSVHFELKAIAVARVPLSLTMATILHQSLTASCRELLEDLTRQRAGLPIEPTQCPISSIISEETLSSHIHSIIAKLKEDFKLDDSSKPEPDTLKSHFEVSGREVILEVAVSPLRISLQRPFSPCELATGGRVIPRHLRCCC